MLGRLAQFLIYKSDYTPRTHHVIWQPFRNEISEINRKFKSKYLSKIAKHEENFIAMHYCKILWYSQFVRRFRLNFSREKRYAMVDRFALSSTPFAKNRTRFGCFENIVSFVARDFEDSHIYI